MDIRPARQAWALLAAPLALGRGDGPGRRAAEQQARSLARPVRFTGFAPHAAIPAVLRHIDLLVLATRYEELSLVLIEGMAAGLPVIASRVGGIPALVDHDVNGLLVPPGDPAALAVAITRVLAEPGTAAQLGAAARQTAQRYTRPALGRQVAEVYLQVTCKPRSGQRFRPHLDVGPTG